VTLGRDSQCCLVQFTASGRRGRSGVAARCLVARDNVEDFVRASVLRRRPTLDLASESVNRPASVINNTVPVSLRYSLNNTQITGPTNTKYSIKRLHTCYAPARREGGNKRCFCPSARRVHSA